ncbi:site-specific integrase [Mesorhizobium sp. B2-2-4]|uniref:site-specific integrase n=1 Tax=unclassified Mesorhizobium TaxID=325217 RepID=UPI00112E9172|nr:MULTISPECIES: site-specific integrase [unclassified Mesorhizobium]TPM61093.1 site-specific integrase [Mesorhizobium sp. B2-2-4]TPM70525.1 site-specific integrase [Mesorhizobium sp. B2-2-1]TPN70377.1 site-specific integrase [Mesorhizobium sp. B1-1-3]
MARLTYLERRGATYYARIDIPVDLVPLYRTTTRKKSLRTKDEATAKSRLWPVIEAWRAEFDDVRIRRQLTADDKADAVWQHYTGTLDRDEQARRSIPTAADIDAATERAVERVQREGIDVRDPLAALDASLDVMVLKQSRALDAQARRVKLDHMRKHLADGEVALINHEVADYIDGNKLLIDPLSPDRGDIARKMMRAEIEGLERTLERDQGDYTGTPRDPVVKPAIGTSREQAAPGETIMEIFEQYARENPKAITADTLNQARRDIGTFVDHVGSTCPVHRIDKKAVREWKALLMRYPVKATESNAFAGMKLAQIVRHNEKVGKPVITPRTVNRYLSSLGAFCDWLVSHGYLDQNPTTGMSLAKEKKRTTVPFTTDQMNTLFKSPLFTGCRSADEWRNVAKPGNVRIRDHRYWVPLIMLYSGARPAEIAQLAVADVRQEHGHWIMHITEEGDGDKSTKNEGSMRVVPVHPELMRLGFIRYRDGMETAGQQRLFPEATRNSRGQMIAEFSREFGRYLTRLGMKDGRGLSLYSFRHGAADALRRAGHLDEQFGFILGHTSATMTGRYGIMPQGMLQQRVELVNSIAYPGLKIDQLF